MPGGTAPFAPPIANRVNSICSIPLGFPFSLRPQLAIDHHFRLPNASIWRELFALHLPNPERVKANLRIASGYLRCAPILALSWKSRSLSGGDILNVCLNAIHAGSRDPDPAKWLVTEEMLVREVRRARAAKARHGGKVGGRRIGFGG